MADGSVTVPVTFSDPEGWDAKGQTFLDDLNIMQQPFDPERQNSAEACGAGRVSMVSDTPAS